MIELNNFGLGYAGTPLLRNIDARFPAGTLTALIGRNGSGKSSLLRVLAGLSHNFSGRVTFDGVSVKSRGFAANRLISFVNARRTTIPSMRVAEVVALGRTPFTGLLGRLNDIDREIIHDSMVLTGVAELAEREFDSLSDGEAQRAMIARALAQTTPALLLDEPTSFLDISNRLHLVELLRKLAHEQNKCVLFSTHELEIALSLADNIALIKDSSLLVKKCSDISSDEIMRNIFS